MTDEPRKKKLTEESDSNLIIVSLLRMITAFFPGMTNTVRDVFITPNEAKTELFTLRNGLSTPSIFFYSSISNQPKVQRGGPSLTLFP